jgi:hypothetical protein
MQCNFALRREPEMAIDFRPMPDARVHAQRMVRPDIDLIVAAMFTANVRDRAARLRASLETAGLNYALYEVPSVHRSISTKGGDDIAFCKPNFIHHVMQELQRPVLYLDADMVVREFPSKILEIARSGIDLAIYNWFADPAADRYEPVRLPVDGVETKNRFYKFSYGLDLCDPGQLLCSGAVQYYGNSDGARHLLVSWLGAIERYPGVADDELLDYAFNFLVSPGRVNAAWLDKEHCRYSWWIHVRPIIDHPDSPAPAPPSRTFLHAAGRERIDIARLEPRPPQGPFPRDCLIDVKEKCLYRIVGATVVPVGRFDTELWLVDS